MSLREPLAREDPSPETIAHFSSTPWATALLTNPSYTPISNVSRTPRPPPSTQETFLSRTLNTSSTIIAWQNFYYKPSLSPSSTSSSASQPSTPSPAKLSSPSTQSSSSPPPHTPKILTLIKLGSDLNGWDNVAHGGFVSVLLDEIIGMACEFQAEGRVFTMTAYLNVSYRWPVSTPGVVLLRGWVERKEGRKIWGRGTIEDGEGRVLSEGEALFVKLKGSL